MRRLKNLDVHEISLVKRAANKRKFLVTKTAGAEMAQDPQSIVDRLAAIPDAVTQKLVSVAKSTFAKADGDVELTDDQQARLKAAGRILAPDIEAMPPEAIAQMLSAIGVTGMDGLMDEAPATDEDVGPNAVDADDLEDAADKADAGDKEDEEEDAADKSADADAEEQEEEGMEKAKDVDMEDCQKQALEKAKDAFVEAMKGFGVDMSDMASPKKEEGESTPAEDAKTVPPIKKSAGPDFSALPKGQREMVASIFKSHAERTDELEALHKEAVRKSAELQTKLDTQEMVQKAAELPHLGAREAMTEMLLRHKQNDPKGFDAQFKVMKSWNDTMDKGGLFVEHGSSLSDDAGDAEAKINRAVESLVQKSGNLTPEQAYTQFVSKTSEGRALYRQYVAEAAARKGDK